MKKLPLQKLLVFLIAATFAISASASRPIKEFKGTRSETTAEFIVQAPWILDWRLYGDYEQMVALDVQLLDAKTGVMIGRILHTKRKGNGVKLFNEGGNFRLRISSTFARWTLKVEQLTEEEAKAYTPRKRSLLDQ